MADLEKILSELLQELLQKRGECEDLHQRHNRELLDKEELRTQAEALRAEVVNARRQLELTSKALHRCEESFSSAREAAVKHKLALDAANGSIDAIKEQATKQHMDNVKLKKQLEDMERNLKAESLFRESCVSTQAKTQTTIESLTAQMRSLEKDSRGMERHAADALSVGKKTKLMLEHKDAVVAELRTRTTDLTSQLVSLTSENRNLQEKIKERKPAEQQHYVKEILQEWQNSVNENKARAAGWEKEADTLHQALQNALDGQLRLQRLEEAANDRVRQLEEKLMSANDKGTRKNTDCSVQTDLNISIDVACETTRVEVGSVFTQTEPAEELEKNPDAKLKTAAQDRIASNEQQSADKHTTTTGAAVTPVTPSTCVGGSSLQQLMAKYHQMGLELSSPRHQDFAEMPTQLNPNVHPN